MSEKPNILLITTDEQRWDSLSFFGKPGYRTPVLDRLAREGLIFNRAYCPSPICTPARVSLLTGLYPSRSGAFTIGTPDLACFDEGQPNLPRLLAEAGYGTAIIGKTHFVARNLEEKHVAGQRYPKGEDPDPDMEFWHNFTGPYVGFEYAQHCPIHSNGGLPSASYRAWLEKQGVNLDEYHREKKQPPTEKAPQFGPWDVPEEYHQTTWITQDSMDYIRRQHEADKPWFCWASYQDPHYPLVCPRKYYDEVDMTGVDLGGWQEGEFADKPPFYQNVRDGIYWTDGERDFWNREQAFGVPNAIEYDRIEKPYEGIRAYIGMCNMIDVYVGKLVDFLDELGVRENTLIIFTTDHGDYLGQHGFWYKGLPAYDDCQKVPMVVNWPKGMESLENKGLSRAFFNLVDIPATCLDAAGLDLAPGMQGASMLPVIRGEAEMVRDWSITEMNPTPYVFQETFVHDDYKMVVYRDAEYGELYNMKEDPEQKKNLWSLPEYAELRGRLLLRMARANLERAGQIPPRVNYA